jgi:hypothetical protein
MSDAARVRTVAESFLTRNDAEINRFFKSRSPTDIFSRVAKQMAFGAAHRLSHGSYISSNIGINGELIDFGTFHSRPQWIREARSDGTVSRTDLEYLDTAVESASYYFKTSSAFCARSLGYMKTFKTVLRRIYERAFQDECLAMLGLFPSHDSATGILASRMWQYFCCQQRVSPAAFTDLLSSPWLWPVLPMALATDKPQGTLNSDLVVIVNAVKNCIKNKNDRMRIQGTILRCLCPRPGLYPNGLMRSVSDAIASWRDFETGTSQIIANCIDLNIARNRRLWRELPTDTIVIAQCVQGCSNALLCVDVPSGQRYLRIEGDRLDQCIFAFGNLLEASLLEPLLVPLSNSRVAIEVKVPAQYTGQIYSFRFGDRELNVPAMMFRFDTCF